MESVDAGRYRVGARGRQGDQCVRLRQQGIKMLAEVFEC